MQSRIRCTQWNSLDKPLALVLASATLACATPARSVETEETARQAVEAVLDALHDSSTRADADGYFGQFSPDAIILGTARGERWTVEGFREFAEPYFAVVADRDRELLERHVAVSDDGALAWFDERVMRGAIGEMRGSGIVRRSDGEWRIVQYNAVFPVPNELVSKLTEMVRALPAEPAPPAEESASPLTQTQREARRAVNEVLTDLHDAASKADGERYLGHLAADAVFYGTDRSERWSVEDFQAYVEPYFSKGKGWTAVPASRGVYLAPDGATAWFDETLDNTSYSGTRGSGVLRKTDGEWKIVHYNLGFTIPNELVADLQEMIRKHEEAK